MRMARYHVHRNTSVGENRATEQTDASCTDNEGAHAGRVMASFHAVDDDSEWFHEGDIALADARWHRDQSFACHVNDFRETAITRDAKK